MKTKLKISNEPPWITPKLKHLIRRRQMSLEQGDLISFRRLRNQVNRERKSCRSKFYEAKVKELKESAPSKWWSEIKKLGGMTEQFSTPEDIISQLHNVEFTSTNPMSSDPDPHQLANLINEAFLAPTKDFSPLLPSSPQQNERQDTPNIQVTEHQVFKSLSTMNPSKSVGPDAITGGVLKENADILAQPIADIINKSYSETHFPLSWKAADVVPIPKEKPVRDINSHLRPISLTSIVSKLAEDYVVDCFAKPAVRKKVDPNQYGTIPNSSTVHALVSMLHSWSESIDGNSGSVRVMLFDFGKAFDLVDHYLLLQKLKTYDLSQWKIDWIKDFLTCRKQRVKLNQECYSEWEPVTAGVPQGTKLGHGYLQ